MRLSAAVALLLVLASPTIAAAPTTDHGVVLLYHHVGEDTPPQTSVTPAQFAAHLDYIDAQGFNVIPLSTLLAGVFDDGSIVDNAVAITFDDAYLSVYEVAMPQLAARGWPFTVFVADAPVDQGLRHYMDWEQLRAVVAAGAEIGGHSVDHAHLVRQLDGERPQEWRSRVLTQINENRRRLEQQLPVSIEAFAYPYGEFNAALQALLEQQGLFGIAQNSGAVGPMTPKTAIPRFPMMRSMATMERLATALRARPLPVESVNVGATTRAYGDRVDEVVLELAPGNFDPDRLACFSASGDRLVTARARLTLTITPPEFKVGRNKINCTVPASGQTGEYFWFSAQWLVTSANGDWYAE